MLTAAVCVGCVILANSCFRIPGRRRRRSRWVNVNIQTIKTSATATSEFSTFSLNLSVFHWSQCQSLHRTDFYFFFIRTESCDCIKWLKKFCFSFAEERVQRNVCVHSQKSHFKSIRGRAKVLHSHAKSLRGNAKIAWEGNTMAFSRKLFAWPPNSNTLIFSCHLFSAVES